MALSSIYHNVPVLRQPKANACWFTCMQMVTRYCRAVGKSPSLIDPADDPVLNGWFKVDFGLSFSDSVRYLTRAGYACSPQSPDLEGLNKLLLNTPVIYAGEWQKKEANAVAGHWVVITGMSDTKISINDPRYGRMMYEFESFFGGDLQLTAEQPLFYPKQ